MILDFSVENFRSYKEEKRLQLTPSSSEVLPSNLMSTGIDGIHVLKSCVIYCANASGKSGLMAAMNTMANLVRRPTISFEDDWFPKNASFTLDAEYLKLPSRFSVRFILNENIYHYTIAVEEERIVQEKLVVHPSGGRGQESFSRSETDIKFNANHLKGPKNQLKEFLHHDTTVMGIASAFNHPQLALPSEWIATNLLDRYELGDGTARIGSRSNRSAQVVSQRCLSDPQFRAWAESVIRHADLGIQAIEIQRSVEKVRRFVSRPSADGKEIVRVPEEIASERHDPIFHHATNSEKTVPFELSDESQGTRRLFSLLAPLYDVFRQKQVGTVDIRLAR